MRDEAYKECSSIENGLSEAAECTSESNVLVFIGENTPVDLKEIVKSKVSGFVDQICEEMLTQIGESCEDWLAESNKKHENQELLEEMISETFHKWILKTKVPTKFFQS